MNEIALFEEKEVALIDKLVAFKKMQNEMENQEKILKEELKNAMEKYGVKQFKNEKITLSYIEESKSVSLDLKKFEQTEPTCYKELLTDYPKETVKKAYVRFTVKG